MLSDRKIIFVSFLFHSQLRYVTFNLSDPKFQCSDIDKCANQQDQVFWFFTVKFTE